MKIFKMTEFVIHITKGLTSYFIGNYNFKMTEFVIHITKGCVVCNKYKA